MKRIKGITLVALVVTIVVLIILATISINIIFGEEGIVERVKQAKQDMANAQEEEEQILADTANSIDGYILSSNREDSVTLTKEQYDSLINRITNLEENNNLTNVGTIYNGTSVGTTWSTVTWQKLNTLTLEPGTYIIELTFEAEPSAYSGSGQTFIRTRKR